MGYFNGIYAASLSILDNNLQLNVKKPKTCRKPN